MPAKPCPQTVAFLRELTRQAESGVVQEVFAWFRCSDRTSGHDFIADDPDDMLYELGSVILLERSAGPREGGTA